MSDSGTVFKNILIWIFAGAIVALGLKDLYRLHGGGKSVSKIEVESLVKDLQGDLDVKKAAMNPEAVQSEQNSGSTEVTSEVPKSISDVVGRIFPDMKKKQ